MAKTVIPARPDWACAHWGEWEHDWLECPACLAGYDRQNEEEG